VIKYVHDSQNTFEWYTATVLNILSELFKKGHTVTSKENDL
jgi:hypothetical protein